MEIQQGSDGATLQDLISRLDVDITGVVTLDELKKTRLGEMAIELLPRANSVVVFAMEIYPEILDLTSLGRIMGEASFNDLMPRHAEFISGRLTKAAYDVAKASRKMGLKALPLPAAGCPMDDRFLKAIFSYKHAGQEAGLGKIGWHSLLVSPDFGPRVRLSCCLTEAPLESTNANGSFDVECAKCGICVDNCPAGALSKPEAGKQYSMNKYACNSFLKASGGCYECTRLCPAGK